MKKDHKARRRQGVKPWKYLYVTVCLILSLILNIAFIKLSLDLMNNAKGVEFEKPNMTCFEHMKTHYCCKRKYFDKILTTNLTTGRQINWTYYPDCYKIQINEVIR